MLGTMRKTILVLAVLAAFALASCDLISGATDTRVVVNSSWQRVEVPRSARSALDDYVATYNEATPDDQLFVYESEEDVPPVELAPDAPIFIARDDTMAIMYQGVELRVDFPARKPLWESTAGAIGDPDTGALIPCTVYVDRVPPAPPPPPVPQLWVALVNWTTKTVPYAELLETEDEAITRYRAYVAQAELNNAGLGDMGEGLWQAYRGVEAFAFPPDPVEP